MASWGKVQASSMSDQQNHQNGTNGGPLTEQQLLTNVLINTKPSQRRSVEDYFYAGDYANLAIVTEGLDTTLRDALFEWSQKQNHQSGTNGGPLTDQQLLTMVLNDTLPSQRQKVRDYFYAGDYANLATITEGLETTLRDALFEWNQKRTATLPPVATHPTLPYRQNSAKSRNYGNSPTNVASNSNGAAAVAKTKTAKPSGYRKFKEVGDWAKIDTKGFNALKQNYERIQEAMKTHDCLLVMNPGSHEHNYSPSYRVLADTREAILIVNQLAIQIMNTTQDQTWDVKDLGLRVFIGTMKREELVAIQQKYGVFIAWGGAVIQGWILRDAAQCHNELNSIYCSANNLPPVLNSSSINVNTRGRGRGRGRAAINNNGNRAVPQLPHTWNGHKEQPLFEQNDFKELAISDNLPAERNSGHLAEEKTESESRNVQSPVPEARKFFEKDFSHLSIVGSGNGGVVRRMKHQNLGIVALKNINSSRSQNDLLNELTFSMTMSAHPNIVRTFGYLFTSPEQMKTPSGIVMEYMDSSLNNVIHGPATFREYSRAQGLAWMRQTASAIDYLHQNNIIHRDVKPHNLLLSTKDPSSVRVCDFGISSEIRSRLTTGRGTCLYMAPEVISQGGKYNKKCDSYSLGMTIWELFHKREPFEGRMPHDIYASVIRGMRCEISKSLCPAAVADLIERCWSGDMNARPDMGEITEMLDRILATEK